MPRPKDPIERLSVHHCRLPVKGRRAHGSGDVADMIEVVLARAETRSGIVGWGEAAPWSVFTGTAEAAYWALARYLGPLAIGRDPGNLPRLMADADAALVGHPEAKAALETALLDILGRRAGVPVHAILGGAYRTEIPLSVSLADPDFERDLQWLSALRTEEVGIIKLKTGFASHAFDLERLEAIRSRFPEFDLRVDYNQGLSTHEALAKLRDIEPFKPTFIEQPVPGPQLEALREITRTIDTPILADESVFSPEDAMRAAAMRAADAFSIKIMKAGGLRRGMQIAGIAEAAGIACYGGDMFETGIAHLAGAHMIAATPNISLGCEFYQARWYLEFDLLVEPFPIERGSVVVPTTPGLGIDIDEAKVAATTIAKQELTVR